jgi:hypothetical protein
MNKHTVTIYGPGGYDPTKTNNNVVEKYEVEEPQQTLDSIGVIATLNAVLGVWPLADAANAVGLTEQDLINEAEAWAVAGEV